MNILDRGDRYGLATNLGAAILLAWLTNGMIAAVNPAEMASARPVRLAPPGYVIGGVWVVLFACLGAARWVTLRAPLGSSRAARPIMYLLFFCLAYPFYTWGLKSLTAGLIGNLATIVLACVVISQTARISRFAAALVAPVALWLCFATVLVVQQLRS